MTTTDSPKAYVQENAQWGVTAEGELWKKGEHGYMAGYVSRPRDEDSFFSGIDAAEEEGRVLLAQAREEFGSPRDAGTLAAEVADHHSPAEVIDIFLNPEGA